MTTEPRDPRVRELVYELVQSAPPPPPMPDPAAVTTDAPSRTTRVRVTAALLTVVIVAVTAAVVVFVQRSPSSRRGAVVAPVTVRAPGVAYVDARGLVVRAAGSDHDVLVASGAVSTPRWSPSGQWLAYRSGNDLWSVHKDGSDRRQLANLAASAGYFEDAFAWSPKVDALAIVSVSGLQVWWFGDGSPHEVLVNFPGGVAEAPVSLAWSPGGASLAVTTERREQPAPKAAIAHDSVWVATNVCRVDTSPMSCVVPDLRRLAYTPGPAEYPIGVAGSAFDDRYVLIWPDEAGSSSIELDGLPLKAVPVDGGPAVTLAPSMLVRDDWVRSSPDGSRLAVVFGNGRMVTDPRALRLCASPSRCRALATGSDTQTVDPAWSADGARVAFVREAPASYSPPLEHGAPDWTTKYRTRRLWIANADGADPTLVAEAGRGVAAPQFSPDGKSIVFVRDAQVWQLDLSTHQVTAVSGSMLIDPSCTTDACLPDAAVYDTSGRWSDHVAVIFPARKP